MAHKDFLIVNRCIVCREAVITDDLVNLMIQERMISMCTVEEMTHVMKTRMQKTAYLIDWMSRRPENKWLLFLDIMDRINHDFAPTLRKLWKNYKPRSPPRVMARSARKQTYKTPAPYRPRKTTYDFRLRDPRAGEEGVSFYTDFPTLVDCWDIKMYGYHFVSSGLVNSDDVDKWSNMIRKEANVDFFLNMERKAIGGYMPEGDLLNEIARVFREENYEHLIDRL